jgi:tyrosinase
MTFAEMLRENARALPNLRKIEWLFPRLCHRKDQARMTDNERQRYICAFNMLVADGTLGTFVDIHAQHHDQHSNARLLPWHRAYLLLFEEALHRHHPDVCIPYWDWTQPEEQTFPAWLAGVTPTVQTANGPLTVVRSPGPDSWLAQIAADAPNAMSRTSYNDFSSPINGIHGGVHVWVGGTMSSPMTSPADPVFWLHHANLDRLWWDWYNSPQGNGKNPQLSGAQAVMDPWTYTEQDLRDIHQLGYDY